MEMTPELIDAAVLQLKGIFEHAKGIPAKVRDSGNTFVNDLDEWSESMKKEKEAAK